MAEKMDRTVQGARIKTGYGVMQIMPVVTERGAEARPLQMTGDLTFVWVVSA